MCEKIVPTHIIPNANFIKYYIWAYRLRRKCCFHLNDGKFFILKLDEEDHANVRFSAENSANVVHFSYATVKYDVNDHALQV